MIGKHKIDYPVTSHQSPVPSHQSPVTSPQSPVPSSETRTEKIVAICCCFSVD
ncbi:hypothetical protein H5968_16755 [Sphaerospermopsis sp. LEGE 00249]|uniref:hypothetical protein n=1 Tax=Sphaerospermopsis sp. LEGE 00249 TaxID=1380707 RepID=UPI00164E7F9C|nr:hypothetical protein [Sphaerospermopsis sp. LEGE 00249]MBC5796753.1 hypothetical protein [Sphaerospermopsis sp. LEGE 00249]